MLYYDPTIPLYKYIPDKPSYSIANPENLNATAAAMGIVDNNTV
jgi:hypothetical protein